jgi:zinc transporter 5/7
MHGSGDPNDLISIPIMDITISDQDSNNGLTERKSGFEKKRSFDFEEEDKERKLGHWVTIIWKDKDCKHLFLFIVLMSSVTLLQLVHGSYSGSLGLLSAAFHAMFHSIALAISLAAMVLVKHKPTSRYSYGYDRFEILSGFTNGIFLLFVCLWILFESVEKLFEPEEIHSSQADKVVYVALLGLAVNIVGVIFFHEFKQTRSESRYENLYGISLGIVMDGSTQLGVILSTWLTQWGFLLADPILAIGIAIWLGYNVIPICTRTGKVLLQSTPTSIKDQLDKARREVQTLEGVLECTNEHFWTQSPGVFVGSLTVRVRADANEQSVAAKTRSLLSPWITHLTIQVEKNDWMLPVAN